MDSVEILMLRRSDILRFGVWEMMDWIETPSLGLMATPMLNPLDSINRSIAMAWQYLSSIMANRINGSLVISDKESQIGMVRSFSCV